MAKNPEMAKSTAFAVATQQSHALGKSPKGYGTVEGKAKAKAKFKTPGDDKKTASVGDILELARRNPSATAGLAGAAIGAATADKDHRLEGAALGGTMGAGAGHLIGHAGPAVAKSHVLGPAEVHAPKLLAEAPKVEITGAGVKPKLQSPKPSKHPEIADAEFEEVKTAMHSVMMSAMADEFLKIKESKVNFAPGAPGANLFATSKPARLPPRPGAPPRPAPGAAPKPDVSRGQLSLGDHIAPQPTAFKPGPLDFSGKTASVAYRMRKLAEAMAKESENRIAIPTRMARTNTPTPAVVGAGMKSTVAPPTPKPLPPKNGPLNPGGMMLH